MEGAEGWNAGRSWPERRALMAGTPGAHGIPVTHGATAQEPGATANHLARGVHPWHMTSMASTFDGEMIHVLARAADGDEVAFGRIVSAYHEDMRRVCVVVAGDAQVADEAVAAAWAIAWRKLRSVRDASRLRPWLVSVAVNEARQLHRRRRRRELVEVRIDLEPSSSARDPQHAIDAIDLRNALARLGDDERSLLAMRYVAGFDSSELAQATGLTPAGTRARLARLLDRLERELSDG
jgi:RNA polymerase sigma factor (sigma-70 family)